MVRNVPQARAVLNPEQCPYQGQSGLLFNSHNSGKSSRVNDLALKVRLVIQLQAFRRVLAHSPSARFSLIYFHRMDEDSSDDVRHTCASALSCVTIRFEERIVGQRTVFTGTDALVIFQALNCGVLCSSRRARSGARHSWPPSTWSSSF